MGAKQTKLKQSKAKLQTYPGFDPDADQIIRNYIKENRDKENSFKEGISKLEAEYKAEEIKYQKEIDAEFDIKEEPYRVRYEKNKAAVVGDTYYDKVALATIEQNYRINRDSRNYQFMVPYEKEQQEINRKNYSYIDDLQIKHGELQKELYYKMIKELNALVCKPPNKWVDYIPYEIWYDL